MCACLNWKSINFVALSLSLVQSITNMCECDCAIWILGILPFRIHNIMLEKWLCGFNFIYATNVTVVMTLTIRNLFVWEVWVLNGNLYASNAPNVRLLSFHCTHTQREKEWCFTFYIWSDIQFFSVFGQLFGCIVSAHAIPSEMCKMYVWNNNKENNNICSILSDNDWIQSRTSVWKLICFYVAHTHTKSTHNPTNRTVNVNDRQNVQVVSNIKRHYNTNWVCIYLFMYRLRLSTGLAAMAKYKCMQIERVQFKAHHGK